jgi:hypothetical protein
MCVLEAAVAVAFFVAFWRVFAMFSKGSLGHFKNV